MKKLRKIEQDDTSLFDEIMQEIPADIRADVRYSIAITERLRELLNLKFQGKQNVLARHMGKTEAEISKWFSGTHNFTIRTLAKLEEAFGEKIITVQGNIFEASSSDMKVFFNDLGYLMEIDTLGGAKHTYDWGASIKFMGLQLEHSWSNCSPIIGESNIGYHIMKDIFQEANLDGLAVLNLNLKPNQILA